MTKQLIRRHAAENDAPLAPWQLARIMGTMRLHHTSALHGQTLVFNPRSMVVLVAGRAKLLQKPLFFRLNDEAEAERAAAGSQSTSPSDSTGLLGGWGLPGTIGGTIGPASRFFPNSTGKSSFVTPMRASNFMVRIGREHLTHTHASGARTLGALSRCLGNPPSLRSHR